MKIFVTYLITFLAISSFSYGEGSKVSVAKVDYSEIEKLVEELVLGRPENKELGTRFKAARKKSEEAQERMQKAIMNGEKINPMEAASGFMHQSGDKKKVETICEKYVLNLIGEVFEGKYQIILKEGYRSSLLYTEIPIDDVTSILRQELLKKLPTEERK